MFRRGKVFRTVLCVLLVASMAGVSCAAMLRSPKQDSESESRRRSRMYLPNTGSVAVLADSQDSQHAAIAEAVMIDELMANGYNVVDDAALARLHRQAQKEGAIARAFGGNVTGIANLGRSAKASYTILARVKAGSPERNEAKLYTGTASAVIMAVSSKGEKIGGRNFSGKAVGYTADEAREKALEKAVLEGLRQLL